jgi:hypothetical protein
MNNINIKNLFIDSDINHEDFTHSNTLNVYNLVESKVFLNNLDDDYIINKIKNNDKKEKNKIKDLYETKYKECLNKIDNAIDMKFTDVYFSVGDSFFGYKNYNSKKCLEYIQNKLRKKEFETLIYNNKQIFISWKNVVDSLK